MAQPSPEASPPEQHSASGIEYMSGGVGDDERIRMAAMQSHYSLKVVMSKAGGDYVVAESFRISTTKEPLLELQDAGPILMVKLPPGRYSMEMVFHGAVKRLTVDLSRAEQQVDVRFPG